MTASRDGVDGDGSGNGNGQVARCQGRRPALALDGGALPSVRFVLQMDRTDVGGVDDDERYI
ncbi:hypothetical protein E4U42_001540, partial [Claviceps africana]